MSLKGRGLICKGGEGLITGFYVIITVILSRPVNWQSPWAPLMVVNICNYPVRMHMHMRKDKVIGYVVKNIAKPVEFD